MEDDEDEAEVLSASEGDLVVLSKSNNIFSKSEGYSGVLGDERS